MLKFCVPYSDDKRMIYAKDYLINLGYIFCDNIDDSDFVLLPIPAKPYMFDNLKGKTVFFGKGDYSSGYDYFGREPYVLENAIVTAESAVALAIENTDKSLMNSHILIAGFGRIGKALLRCLCGFGAEVTVCSRSRESSVLAQSMGAKHIEFAQLRQKNNFDIVFNTVPHMVFTKDELCAFKKGVCLIDLASFPGGVDTLVASSKGINLINGKGLPSRYAVKTAGELIAKEVDMIIKEERL